MNKKTLEERFEMIQKQKEEL